MKVLCCHPGGFVYTDIYLRLEPLGLELVAQAVRAAGHEVRIVDLKVFSHKRYIEALESWRPDAVCFSLNYLANIPEVIDLAGEAKACLPDCVVFAGGHSASFTAREILDHARGTLDCVVKGEGEEIVPRLLSAWESDRQAIAALPGIVTPAEEGPPPVIVKDIDRFMPAHDLVRRRDKYFVGDFDPAASVEFTRGCPWDCAFCSAWTFYGRSYRMRNPQAIAEELGCLKEKGIFIVDDVAFVNRDHAFEVGKEVERRRIKKNYYAETRCDVFLTNREVFRYWKGLGLKYLFFGMEAIDDEGLLRFRKRSAIAKNFEALEVARSLGLVTAVNIIADPDWDENRFRLVREWALSVPEVVNISVNTPYPGTEIFHSNSKKFITRDYRLFDIQHAVVETKMPLDRFYRELVNTQKALSMKHRSLRTLMSKAAIAARLLIRRQTNFVRTLWRFNSIFDAERQMSDHGLPTRYQLTLPTGDGHGKDRLSLYVLRAPERGI